MKPRRWRVAQAADADIEHALRETARRFGPRQRDAYAALIERALALVAEAPDRPSSRRQDKYVAGLRSFHIGLAAARRRAGAHVLFYLGAEDPGGDLTLVRVLHESMEPMLWLIRGAED